MSSEPVSQRMVRPLLPRPFTNNASTFSPIPTHFCSHHNPKLTSWTQPPLCDYGGKRSVEILNRGMGVGVPVVSSRWNPTAEQVQALEEMYRRGTRTPTAEQIQQIAAKLRRFGKIEGKNVFYWFQNHKARDRQKKRRQLELSAAKNNIDIPLPQQIRKQSAAGLSRKYNLEMEHPTMSKCSTGSKYDGGELEECKKESWTNLELQQQRVTANSRDSSCRALDLLSLSMHKIIDQKSSLNPCKQLSPKNDSIVFGEFESGIKENRTLELFPVRERERESGMMMSCSSSYNNKEEMDEEVSTAGTKLVPNQFFEFLPTKN